MDALLNDLRFSLRMLARNPAFTAFTVATLGIGLGLNTALFSVINGVLLNPLPYERPAELVDVRSKGDELFPVSWPNLSDWRDQSKSFAALAAYTVTAVNLTGAGDAERVPGVAATGELFAILGVAAARGRVWDARAAGDDGVVISDALWRQRYAARPEIVGSSIVVNGVTRTIIGVMPANFGFADGDLWLRMMPPTQSRRGNFNLMAVGRLAPGTSLAQAQQELDAIGARLAQQYPNNGVGPQLRELRQSLVGEVRRPLLTLLVAVGFVLLVACVNLASLTLARDDRRRRELAVRASLGASRARLIRQLLTEALVSSALACVFGVLLAVWGTELLLARMPDAVPRAGDVRLDARVLGFALLSTCLTALLFGLWPALRAAATRPAAAIVEGGRAVTAGAQRQRARRVLIIAELALALVPLAGAGLLLRSLDRLFAVDLGFRTEQVLTADYFLPSRAYSNNEQLAAYAERLITSVRALPGARAVGVITPAPLSSESQSGSFQVEGRPIPPAAETPWSEMRAASSEYFAAAGIPLLRGRAFQRSDNVSAIRVALIDATFAARHFPGEDPIGKRIVMGFDRVPREIIGVVGAIRDAAPTRAHEPHIYFPFAQQTLSSATLAVRAAGDPRALISAVRQAARTVDANIPLYQVRTLEDAQRQVLARSRFSTMLFGLFALCALLMAAAGVYGVMSFWVADQRREIGIRLALGARPNDILRMVVGEGARLTSIGLALGLAGALACGQALAGMLFQTPSYDPLALAAVTSILAVVALCACYLPARRAAGLDTLAAMTEA